MSKKNEPYSPPEDIGCLKFIWDSDTSQCLGRTGGSWGKSHHSIEINFFSLFLFPSWNKTAKILCFYVIFYAALSGFFAAIFAVFYQTLEMDKPKWLLDNGLIGNNPGEYFSYIFWRLSIQFYWNVKGSWSTDTLKERSHIRDNCVALRLYFVCWKALFQNNNNIPWNFGGEHPSCSHSAMVG